MPKYLIRGSYSGEGLKGLLEEGGSKRREAAEQALSLAATNASGAVKSRMTVLITPEEVDQATKRTVKFRPPGK